MATFSQWLHTLRRSNTNRLCPSLSTFSMARSRRKSAEVPSTQGLILTRSPSYPFRKLSCVFLILETKSLTPTVTLWITCVMPFFAIFMQVLNVLYRTALLFIIYRFIFDRHRYPYDLDRLIVHFRIISSPLCHVCRVENKSVVASGKNNIFLSHDNRFLLRLENDNFTGLHFYFLHIHSCPT